MADSLPKAKLETCPVCGIQFLRMCSRSAWGYAYDGILVCSYKCMREMEKKSMAAQEKPVDKAQRRKEILDLFRGGVPVRQIASRYAMTAQGVWYVIRSEKKKEMTAVSETANAKDTNVPCTPMDEQLEAELKNAKAEISSLQQQLVVERSTRCAAIRLMYAWKDKYRMERKLRDVEKVIELTESELFTRLREAETYDGVSETATDPAEGVSEVNANA